LALSSIADSMGLWGAPCLLRARQTHHIFYRIGQKEGKKAGRCLLLVSVCCCVSPMASHKHTNTTQFFGVFDWNSIALPVLERGRAQRSDKRARPTSARTKDLPPPPSAYIVHAPPTGHQCEAERRKKDTKKEGRPFMVTGSQDQGRREVPSLARTNKRIRRQGAQPGWLPPSRSG
jgi:hypothetical protein